MILVYLISLCTTNGSDVYGKKGSFLFIYCIEMFSHVTCFELEISMLKLPFQDNCMTCQDYSGNRLFPLYFYPLNEMTCSSV